MIQFFKFSLAVLCVLGFYAERVLTTDGTIDGTIDGTESTDVICGLPKVIGECKADAPRFFYNTATEKCEKFTYGGCHGNKNNFVTEEECNNKCVKKQPVPDCEMPKCMPGCDLRTPENEKCPKCFCSRKKPCFENIDEGSCGKALPRFFFIPSANGCRNFTYGGCGGNGNNFVTKEECEETCVEFSRPRDSECPMMKCIGNCPIRTDKRGCNVCNCQRQALCYLPAEPGSSDANITRFYFNSEIGACQSFQYRGADGNENNFVTLKQCKHTCKTQRTKVPPKPAENDVECEPNECPRDCGEDIRNGCRRCICDGTFFPVVTPLPNQ